MLSRWREQKGAALVEYVLVLPMVLLLFLGALEVYRVISLRQTLRTAFKQELPCFNHWRDVAYREAYSCSFPEIAGRIAAQMDSNPFSRRIDAVRIVNLSEGELEGLTHGTVFEVAVEADLEFGFLYPFEGGPTFTLRESAMTFVDSSPDWLQINWENPFPSDPGELP